MVNGWWRHQNYLLVNYCILAYYIYWRCTIINNNQCCRPNYVSVNLNNWNRWHMGMFKWNNFLIQIQSSIKRYSNPRSHKNQSLRCHELINWCRCCLSILFFQQKLDYQWCVMCIYYGRRNQNHEIHKFKNQFIFIVGRPGSTNDFCWVHSFC